MNTVLKYMILICGRQQWSMKKFVLTKHEVRHEQNKSWIYSSQNYLLYISTAFCQSAVQKRKKAA